MQTIRDVIGFWLEPVPVSLKSKLSLGPEPKDAFRKWKVSNAKSRFQIFPSVIVFVLLSARKRDTFDGTEIWTVDTCEWLSERTRCQSIYHHMRTVYVNLHGVSDKVSDTKELQCTSQVGLSVLTAENLASVMLQCVPFGNKVSNTTVLYCYTKQ